MFTKCFSGAIRDRRSAALALVVLFALPTPAYAYIDPGAGSMAYQAIAAVLIGASFFVRRIGARSKAVWRVLTGRANRPTPPAA